MDTEITDEFQQVLDLLSVATPPVVFVTGSAGTGKSTLIDVLRYELDKNLVVVAPTGVAALNVQGQTIHSLFQLPPGPQPRAKRIAGAAKDVVEKMEVLVIDEVSMVRADLLDAIDDSLRLNTGRAGAPFGGKTLVLVGDMHQLPPVVAGAEEQRLFEEAYESPYFFSAMSLRELPMVTVTLTRSFRQADAEFIRLLDHIRAGTDLDDTVEQLNRVVEEEMIPEETRLVLTSVNARARQFNEQQLAQLPGEAWTFDAEVNGDWLDNESQLPSPAELRLKVDAQVMFSPRTVRSGLTARSAGSCSLRKTSSRLNSWVMKIWASMFLSSANPGSATAISGMKSAGALRRSPSAVTHSFHSSWPGP